MFTRKKDITNLTLWTLNFYTGDVDLNMDM